MTSVDLPSELVGLVCSSCALRTEPGPSRRSRVERIRPRASIEIGHIYGSGCDGRQASECGSPPAGPAARSASELGRPASPRRTGVVDERWTARRPVPGARHIGAHRRPVDSGKPPGVTVRGLCGGGLPIRGASPAEGEVGPARRAGLDGRLKRGRPDQPPADADSRGVRAGRRHRRLPHGRPRISGGMPTSSWACCREPRTYEHAHEDVGMPPGPSGLISSSHPSS